MFAIILGNCLHWIKQQPWTRVLIFPGLLLKLWAALAITERMGCLFRVFTKERGRRGAPVDKHGPVFLGEFARNRLLAQRLGRECCQPRLRPRGSAFSAHHERLPQSQPWERAVCQRNTVPHGGPVFVLQGDLHGAWEGEPGRLLRPLAPPIPTETVYLFLGRGLQAGGFNESFRHELSQGDVDPDVSTPMPRLLGNLVGQGIGRKSSPGPTPEWKLREGRAWPQGSKPQSPSLLPTRAALVCRYCCGGLTLVSQTKSEPLGRRLRGEARGIKMCVPLGPRYIPFPPPLLFFFSNFCAVNS